MSPISIVQSCLESFYRERKDYDRIQSLLREDFRFAGPMARFEKRAAFMKFIREIGPQKNRIEIRGIFGDREDVAVFHDFHSETPKVGPLPFAEWYSVRDGKIRSLELFFGAREFARLISEERLRRSGGSSPDDTRGLRR